MHAPQRFAGASEEGDPFITWADGKPVTRLDLQAVISRAAVACGDDPSRMGSHSLRFGGATALWAAFRDSALVQRWGRWQSEAFHGYLWEGRDNAKGVAEAMAAAQIAML